jgi:cobalt-zinc-cadmium resistance protein CzcA
VKLHIGNNFARIQQQHLSSVFPELIPMLNHDGSLPPGVRVVPYYDRSSLIAIATHTVLHNLIFGCVLVFLIQHEILIFL